MAAGAAVPISHEAAHTQGLSASLHIPPDAVRINANENPKRPCTEAIEAIARVLPLGGRNLYEHTFAFVAAMA